jgi:PTS system mannose-specific IIA component
MIGVVIVAHGGLAGEFRAALEHVVGAQSQLESFPIGPDDDVEQRRLELIEAIRRVDTGGGVVVLTDMFGGTPSNLAISVMSETGAEVLAGINLPMLIKLASVRGREPLETCVSYAQEAGRKYISVASYVLAGEK